MAHRTKTVNGKEASSSDKPNICRAYKKCQSCKKQLCGKELKFHKCWHALCPSCKQYVDLKSHKCFIQVIKEESEDESSTREEAEELSEGEVSSTEEPGIKEAEEDDIGKEEEPPLFIYFDVEARQDTGHHTANLLCVESDQNDKQHTFWGESCIEDFVKWLEDLQETTERTLIVVAHNFKGYDDYFLLEEYYNQMVLPKQLVNGAKILFMSVGKIKFKDSLCFLLMTLSAFSETFGLTELKEGFFSPLLQ